MQLKDIKSRVILVDFVSGSHGHFFVSVMNSLVQENYEISKTGNNKNFHGEYFIPPTIWTNKDTTGPLDNVEFSESIIKSYNASRPIFWGMHWSDKWKNPKQYVPGFRSYIDGYNLVELYFSMNSHEKYFINSIFNVGNISREDLLDPAKFIHVFYKHALEIDPEIVIGIEQNQPWKVSSADQIQQLLESWLTKQNKPVHSGVTKAFNPPAVRPLAICDVLNPCVSFDVSYFYNYNMFVSMVERVFGYYNLSVPINYEFLKMQWDNLMSKQVKNNIRNLDIPGQELHPAQLAYRNYLRKFNAL